MNLNKILGLRIKEYRNKRNLTQDELAHQAGLHTTFIAHIETGNKACSLKTLQKIASTLKTSACHLLCGYDVKEQPPIDPKLIKLVSVLKSRTDSDIDMLQNIAEDIFKRDKKVYRK